MGWEMSLFFWQHPTQLVTQGACSHSNFSSERNHGWWRSLLAVAALLWEKANVSKIKLLLLPSLMHLKSYLFCSNGVLELLLWRCGLPHGTSCPWETAYRSVSKDSLITAGRGWSRFIGNNWDWVLNFKLYVTSTKNSQDNVDEASDGICWY